VKERKRAREEARKREREKERKREQEKEDKQPATSQYQNRSQITDHRKRQKRKK